MTINPTLDVFDRARHSLNLNVQLGDALLAVEPFITLRKGEADKTALVIIHGHDN